SPRSSIALAMGSGTYLFNSALCVFLMYILAYNNAFLVIWPAFGSVKQLLASLALMAVNLLE
ncbi:carbon starvation CstA 5TM domain-containing protein, partial [Proteus mirabilis]|uniref:carbon starvation CstA 5TM domain-containing protein n=1 Tax=Proteus mirabilis TaxID=584 RepID=UPI001952B4B3